VPAVLIGVALALWLTGTTLNVQSFMGAIMALGIAMANSILLASFAERTRLDGESAVIAATHGALGRLRPILMTALAMMAGMLPMALGLGEGGAQASPLGRAVIGGVLFATLATLSVLPGFYALLLHKVPARTPTLLAETG
jgi:multidrug efflux pump subunit AcrB